MHASHVRGESPASVAGVISGSLESSKASGGESCLIHDTKNGPGLVETIDPQGNIGPQRKRASSSGEGATSTPPSPLAPNAIFS